EFGEFAAVAAIAAVSAPATATKAAGVRCPDAGKVVRIEGHVRIKKLRISGACLTAASRVGPALRFRPGSTAILCGRPPDKERDQGKCKGSDDEKRFREAPSHVSISLPNTASALSSECCRIRRMDGRLDGSLCLAIRRRP